jgi:hypothetical protein
VTGSVSERATSGGGPAFPRLELVLGSVAALLGAVWAWLGRRVKGRSAAGRRWLAVLAALLLALACAMWLPLALRL